MQHSFEDLPKNVRLFCQLFDGKFDNVVAGGREIQLVVFVFVLRFHSYFGDGKVDVASGGVLRLFLFAGFAVDYFYFSGNYF
jgi:hypothetical protein